MRPFADSLTLFQRAERWLLPGACLLCQEPVDHDGDPLICALCLGRFRRLPQPLCHRCGQPQAGPPEPCRVCTSWPDYFGLVRSAVWMDELARSAAHHLKYGAWPRIAESLAAVVAPVIEAKPGTILVPVPLSPSRLRRRGYNQADVLARALSGRLGLPVRSDLVKRVRETTTQTALAPEARQANVSGAFQSAGGIQRPVLLVDDVFTTGATLLAVGQALFEGGAKTVGAVTFARAQPPLG